MALPTDDDGNVDRESTIPDDIDSAQDAANFLGIPVTASEDEIQVAYRELSTQVHPDTGGNAEAFKSLSKAQDFLMEWDGEREAQQDAQEARTSGAPGSPGTGGWSAQQAEKQDQYRATVEAVKVSFIGEILGVDTTGAATVEELLNLGTIDQQDLTAVDQTLRQNYGIPSLTLDDVARVIASLVTTGSIDLGAEKYAAERGGVFSGRREGPFSGRRGQGPFRRSSSKGTGVWQSGAKKDRNPWR